MAIVRNSYVSSEGDGLWINAKAIGVVNNGYFDMILCDITEDQLFSQLEKLGIEGLVNYEIFENNVVARMNRNVSADTDPENIGFCICHKSEKDNMPTLTACYVSKKRPMLKLVHKF